MFRFKKKRKSIGYKKNKAFSKKKKANYINQNGCTLAKSDKAYYLQYSDGRRFKVSKEDFDKVNKAVKEYYREKYKASIEDSREKYNERLKDVVSRYTAHMQVKFSLPDSEFKEHYRNNYKLAIRDKKFRDYLLDDY